MYSITKEFSFEYSHKLNMNYDSACKNLHGHSAKVIVQIWSERLNDNHMIVDFTHLNSFKTYLDDTFDHSVILNGKDSLVEVVKFGNLKNFILENNIDPTSEIMARIIWDKFAYILNDMTVNWDEMEITFYETAKNCASYKSKYKMI